MNKYRAFGILILIGLLVSIYTMTSAGRFHIVDEVSLFAVTESLATRGEVDTNAIAWTQWVNSPGEVLGAFGPDGQVYSKKGPAPAFLAAPWYLLLRMGALIGAGFGLLQATLLWNGIITALTAALLWLTANRLGYRNRTGALLGLLFGLATIAWPYANQFFGEPLSAFALLLTFYGILSWRRSGRVFWMAAAGVGAGLAIATVTAHVLLVGVLGLYALAGWWWHDKQGATDGAESSAGRDVKGLLTGLAAFAIPILIAGALLMWYNAVRFGSPFETGYHFDSGEGFTTPIWQGFWGLIFSPYRGVFWHTPLFLVSIVAFVPFTRRHKVEGVTIAVLSLVLVGLYSLWWMWWGGFAWGPRFLVPLTPFWVLALAPWTEQVVNATTRPSLGGGLRKLGGGGVALLAFGLLSLVVQVAAVTVNFVNYEIRLRDLFPTDWADPLKFGPPAQGVGDFFRSPVFGQFWLMRDNFVANTDLAWLWPDGNVQWLLVLMGMLVCGTLAAALVFWWRADDEGGNVAPSVPMRVLIALLPLVLMATWMGETSRNPGYGSPGQGYRAVLETICTEEAPGQDVVVTIAPFSYQIPMNWMPTLCRSVPPLFGYAKNSMAYAETEQVMSELMAEYRRVWFVTGGLPVNDPENNVERWLADNAFKAEDQWYDDFRLVRYATPAGLESAPVANFSIPLRTESGRVVTIMSAQVPQAIKPGGILPIRIDYEIVTPQESDLRWFVQLISPEGYPVALLDTGPLDGYVPLTALPVNQALSENAALQLPVNAAPGVYQLIAGLYDPASPDAARLRTPDGSDFVELGKITVGEIED